MVIHEKKTKVWVHSGDAGDLVYGLPTVKSMGGGDFIICPEHRSPMGPRVRANEAYCENFRALLEEQDYITSVSYSEDFPEGDVLNLSLFRQWWNKDGWGGGPTSRAWMPILKLHLEAFGVKYNEREPWLRVSNPVVVPDRPIVINYTERYNNMKVNLWGFIEKYHGQLVFVGTPEEYERFRLYCLPIKGIPHYPTPNLLELARVIAGSKFFVGNQSCPLAIAQGLGKRALVEKVEGYCRHAVVNNGQSIYFEKGDVVVPQEWL